MDAASHVACKDMLRVMKFVVDTKQYCLKMQPVEVGKAWDLVSYATATALVMQRQG
jgi:hypothetical protein